MLTFYVLMRCILYVHCQFIMSEPLLRKMTIVLCLGIAIDTDRPKLFPSPICPDQLWGPSTLLLDGHSGSFSKTKSCLCVLLTSSEITDDRGYISAARHIFMARTGTTSAFVKSLLSVIDDWKSGGNRADLPESDLRIIWAVLQEISSLRNLS
jgi:hypothetical protein